LHDLEDPVRPEHYRKVAYVVHSECVHDTEEANLRPAAHE